jgi:hydroxyquinol 1,2-dioxygenase
VERWPPDTVRNINEDTITQAVIARHAEAPDARLREVMTCLVQHLHAFAREVKLTEAEWDAGIRFLTETGQICSPTRQEFVLLSDTLGLSSLVTAMAHRKPDGCTEASPAGAQIEAEGAGAARTSTSSADDGSFGFRTQVADPQPIPHDGPVGRMLAALGRHAWRPANLRFAVRAPGHEPLVTHVFRAGGAYLDTDAVFGVRRSLVADWVRHERGRAPDGTTSLGPFYTLDFDFVLNPEAAG